MSALAGGSELPQGGNPTSHSPSFQPLALGNSEKAGWWVGHLLMEPRVACLGQDLHASCTLHVPCPLPKSGLIWNQGTWRGLQTQGTPLQEGGPVCLKACRLLPTISCCSSSPRTSLPFPFHPELTLDGHSRWPRRKSQGHRRVFCSCSPTAPFSRALLHLFIHLAFTQCLPVPAKPGRILGVQR